MVARTNTLWLFITAVQATPLLRLKDASTSINQDDRLYTPVGVPATNRTIFTIISLSCMGILSFLLGSQFGRLKRNILRRRNFVSMLVLIIYALVLTFIFAAAVLVAGQGLKTFSLCRAGIWVCLVLYTFTKAAIFIFLVERIHIVRAPFVRRRHDKLYLVCLVTVLVLFGPVILNSYASPVITMGRSNTRCHFGVKGRASIPVLAVSTFVDLVLTSVFLYLLRPAIDVHQPSVVSNLVARQGNGHFTLAKTALEVTNVQRNIRKLLWKSVIGSLLIELPMMANMIQFVVTKGEELGTVCMALCVVELVWDALVIHWLVLGTSTQTETNMERAGASSSCQASKAHQGYIQLGEKNNSADEDREARSVARPQAVKTKSLDSSRRSIP